MGFHIFPSQIELHGLFVTLMQKTDKDTSKSHIFTAIYITVIISPTLPISSIGTIIDSNVVVIIIIVAITTIIVIIVIITPMLLKEENALAF